MTEIFAKIESEYKMILNQDDNVLTNFKLSSIEAIDYSPSQKLDDDQWFQINSFSKKDYFIDQCSADFSSASLNQIVNDDYSDISCIIISQGSNKYFQRITPSLFVSKRTILDYSGKPKIVEHRKQIEIRDEPDAVYLVDNDTLYFKTIGKLKVIFPGIEVLHREATQDEVNAFIKNDFISLSTITNTSIGPQNRKRIADIGVKYNALSDEKKDQLITYAKEKAGVEVEGDSFVIKSETDLKNVLYAMDQRYYYADIYEENRVANSVRKVKEQAQ
jgi:hypothetical protein